MSFRSILNTLSVLLILRLKRLWKPCHVKSRFICEVIIFENIFYETFDMTYKVDVILGISYLKYKVLNVNTSTFS